MSKKDPEATKNWVVKTTDAERPDKLEELLNQLTAEGYQVFKIDEVMARLPLGELEFIQKHVTRIIAHWQGPNV